MSTDEHGKHFVITLMLAEDEDPQDYVRRCQDIAEYARERSSDSAIDISTPPDIEGAPRFEDALSDRDTHFASYADLLWKGIMLTMQRSVQAVPPLIAQRAYDLVFRHALVYLREGADIPDMTAWPEQSE